MFTEKEIREKRKLLNETDRHLAATFKALGDVTRLRMFRLLTDHPEMSVSTLAKILHISAPLTSQHIKVLVHAQLLKKDQKGKNVFSKLDRRNPVVLELIRTVQKVIKTEP